MSDVLGKVPVTGQKRGSGRISGDVPQRDFWKVKRDIGFAFQPPTGFIVAGSD
jgi:hypothetical protein